MGILCLTNHFCQRQYSKKNIQNGYRKIRDSLKKSPSTWRGQSARTQSPSYQAKSYKFLTNVVWIYGYKAKWKKSRLFPKNITALCEMNVQLFYLPWPTKPSLFFHLLALPISIIEKMLAVKLLMDLLKFILKTSSLTFGIVVNSTAISIWFMSILLCP